QVKKKVALIVIMLLIKIFSYYVAFRIGYWMIKEIFPPLQGIRKFLKVIAVLLSIASGMISSAKDLT
ncbi:MAG: hypothetical protein EZS28_055626, partial [Streblomastix strix]